MSKTKERAAELESQLRHEARPILKNPKVQNGAPPRGWKEVETKIAGFWVKDAIDDGPICGKLVGGRTWVKDDIRSTLFLIQLGQPCLALVPLEGGGGADYDTVQAGEVVGVFESAGLSSLRDFGNCRVWIAPNGERRLKGRKSPMKLYRIVVHPEDKPEELVIREAKRRRARDSDEEPDYGAVPEFP